MIDETLRLSDIYLIFQSSLKNCVINIDLTSNPSLVHGNLQHCPYCGGLD